MADLKIFTNNIEEKAKEQIDLLIAQQAFSDSKIRVMPDVHAGKGCVIGFTADLGDKVIPNIVGVDIGCGVLCVSLGNIDINFEKLDSVIREFVPSGRNVHNKIQSNKTRLEELYCFSELQNFEWLFKSMGTLGGGNHFIEIDIDDDNNKYLLIHTGSRNLGKQVAEIYQNIAIEHCLSKKDIITAVINSLKSQGKQNEIEKTIQEIKKINRGLPKELCYLEYGMREEYLHDMYICQQFAVCNRSKIADIILEKLDIHPKKSFESVHNYIGSDNIVRKGAISAKESEKVVIPLNMRDGCILGVGLGNEDWNNSAPHGAGRKMSRMSARNTLSLGKFKDSMTGIYTTCVNQDTIDESPQAYKDSSDIITVIGETVKIEKIIKPVYNFKASE